MARPSSSLALLAVGALLVCLAGCGSAPTQRPAAAPPETFTVAASVTRATDAVPEARRLNIGITAFDPGLAGSEPGPIPVYPELRRAEARFLPYLLRRTLVDTEQWGAVRVLPDLDPTAELRVTGRIRRSDGERLVLYVRAVDASGEVWLERTYRAPAGQADYRDAAERDPYQPLFNRIAEDLLDARERRSDQELERLTEVTLLAYAADLAPAAFGSYLETAPDGRLQAVRLPARGDPLIERIERVRESEYLFADTLDAHYGELHADMRTDYTLWRRYSLEEIEGLRRYRSNVSERRRDDGSIRAMMARYGDFRELKLQEAALRQAASTLDRVIGPTVMAVEGTEITLEGSLELRYGEWRSLLRRIHAAESALPPP